MLNDMEGFQLLQLEDMELFRHNQEDMMVSDLGFTQLYAWQEVFHNRYKMINNHMCIFYQRLDHGMACYPPLGQYDKSTFERTIIELERECSRQGTKLTIEFVPENWLNYFQQLKTTQVHVSYDDKFSDYIYKGEDFLCLSGRANEHKRYLYNYFINHFTYQYQQITKGNIGDVCDVMNAWCKGRNCQECYWGCEKRAVFRILNHWDRFQCKGCLILVEGAPKAFMIGEQISSDMVVSHFQKADRQVKGLYQFISRQFFTSEYPGIKYINLQEDMGIERIRRAKMSYRPCYMLRKYSISFNGRNLGE